MPKSGEFFVETLLSARTKEGMVNIEIQEDDVRVKIQCDIAKARHIRDMLQEAIEAAISDQMIYEFMTKRVGLSDEKAGYALQDFRFIRQGHLDGKDPS